MAESAADLIRKRQLLTTETKTLTTTVTTETTVSIKGDNYIRTEDLYDQLSDLVNDKFRLWYYKHLYRLGPDTVMRLASTARQEAHTDRRRYFSSLLKSN
jgi:hypothetical protein